MGWLIITAVILALQIVVMVLSIKCDIRHDKRALTSDDKRRLNYFEWWENVGWCTLWLFLFGAVFEVAGGLYFLMECLPEYDREISIKCETIEGEFSKKLNACYKNGVKIVFNEGEQVYGE